MLTQEKIVDLEKEAVALLSTLSQNSTELLKNRTESKLRMEEDPRERTPESQLDPASIHFNVSVPLTQDLPDFAERRQERVLYAINVSDDLETREMDFNSGSLVQRQERLKTQLVQEWVYLQLIEAVQHGKKQGSTAVNFLLLNTIPCILHAENRIALKLMTQLLVTGLSKVLAAPVYEGERSEGGRIKKFLQKAEKIINKDILGTRANPAQWQVPFDTVKKEICVLTMENGRCRRVVDELERLIELCIDDPTETEYWLTAVRHYRYAMIQLRQKTDLSDSEIYNFQKNADIFFQAWVNLYGREGLTNYIHMMGAGHFAEYLFQWRNLYQHSQQGWEAFNALLKNYYFKRTQRGGGRKHSKSRLKPIGKWLQRRMMFMVGLTEASLREQLDNTDT
jgi:hypothetical protein